MVELELLAVFYVNGKWEYIIKRSSEVLGENDVFMDHKGEPKLDGHLRRSHENNLQVNFELLLYHYSFTTKISTLFKGSFIKYS